MRIFTTLNIAILVMISLPAYAGFERFPAPPGTEESTSKQLVSIQAISSVNQITDGSFEACNPSSPPDACPNWIESSTFFGTPVCNYVSCGNGNGTVGPRTGNNWAWFGGGAEGEIGLISQGVTISQGSVATLSFYLWFGVCGNSDDTISFSIDSTVLFTADCNDSRFTSGYQVVEIDVTTYADGLPHDFKWSGIETTEEVTNMSLDDISLLLKAPTPVPTLSEWAQILLALSLVAMAGWYWQRRAS